MLPPIVDPPAAVSNDEDMAADAASNFASIFVERVRIHNFRGLSELTIDLEPDVTLLVGRNNAGKSRVLRALALALGAEVPQLDDLTVDSAEPAEIDVVLAPPRPAKPTDEDAFDLAITRRLAAAQTLREDPLRERFAWRTILSRSAEGLGARTDARVLIYDLEAGNWALTGNAAQLSRNQRSLVAAHLVETSRDLVDELVRRGSAVRRVLSDLEVPIEERAKIEDALQRLGQRIVAGSRTLDAVTQALERLEKTVASLGKPALNPLPVRLEELARSVAIDLDAGTGALPIRLHGSGARSLASLQVQSVLYERRLGADGTAIRPQPVTLIEEPEAHLHPQATFELADLLENTKGQVVASTHSTHLVTTVNPRSIRLIRQEGAASIVVDLKPVQELGGALPRARRPALHASEMEKLKRMVERPFGELLFANFVVIGDGATERAFLPPILRHALGIRGHAVCVIDPGSMANDLAIAAVKFANLVAIPWLLFSDADETGKRDANNLIESHGNGNSSLIVYGGASRLGMKRGATEEMLLQFNEDLCRSACRAVNPDASENSSALDLLKAAKGSAGASLAHALIQRYPDTADWPTPLCELVRKLEDQL